MRIKVKLLYLITALLVISSCIKIKTHLILNKAYKEKYDKRIGVFDYRKRVLYEKGKFRFIAIYENARYVQRSRNMLSNLMIYKERKLHSVFIYPVFEEREIIKDSIYKILVNEKLIVDKEDSLKINIVLGMTVRQYPIPTL